MRELLHKPFILPLAGAPAAEEDDATDILVEGETYPHAYKAQAQRNADDIAEANGDAPLEYDANDDGIDGIIGIIFQWSIAVGLSYVIGIPLGLGLVGMWVGFALDENIRGIILLRRWRSGKWKNKGFVK